MQLNISAKLKKIYFKSLMIVKRGQKDNWKYFIGEVPSFSIPIVCNSCVISGLITHLYYKKMINDNVLTYERIWVDNETEILNKLDDIFGFAYEERIDAFVCITPLYLRNIERGEFLLPTNADKERLLEIIVHELSHFYFFKGCMEKGIPVNEAWLMSEQIVPYLLKAYFSNLCSVSKTYVENPLPEEEEIILLWLDRKIVFDDFLNMIFRKEKVVWA